MISSSTKTSALTWLPKDKVLLKTKGRTEVRGGGRKAFRQKGTGGARRGSLRSPLLKGGGTVFGPKVRTYSVRLNKKIEATGT